eukprot:115002_1
MLKQIMFMIVVFLALGQSMDPAARAVAKDQKRHINKAHANFIEWKATLQTDQNKWNKDKILEDESGAMVRVHDRFGLVHDALQITEKFGEYSDWIDSSSFDPFEAVVTMSVAEQQELDRVISVILKDAKSMAQNGVSSGSQTSQFVNASYTLSIASKYFHMGIPM